MAVTSEQLKAIESIFSLIDESLSKIKITVPFSRSNTINIEHKKDPFRVKIYYSPHNGKYPFITEIINYYGYDIPGVFHYKLMATGDSLKNSLLNMIYEFNRILHGH